MSQIVRCLIRHGRLEPTTAQALLRCNWSSLRCGRIDLEATVFSGRQNRKKKTRLMKLINSWTMTVRIINWRGETVPENITDVTMHPFHNAPLDKFPLSRGTRRLVCGARFRQPLDPQRAPVLASLVTLHMDSHYRGSVGDLSLCHSLKRLNFGDYCNHPVNQLPGSLTHLTLGNNFHNLVDHLPSSLTHLTFGYYFCNRIDHLPLSITHLSFGAQFNQPITRLAEMQSLVHVVFGTFFNHSVDVLVACSSLRRLTFLGWIFEHHFSPPLLTQLRHLEIEDTYPHVLDPLPDKSSKINPETGWWHQQYDLQSLRLIRHTWNRIHNKY